MPEATTHRARPKSKENEAELAATRKFLAIAFERAKLAEEAEEQNRAESLTDFEFSTGKQWAADIETARTIDGRPCLTMDHIQPAIAQITNEQRQQRPSGNVNPVGDGADVETAEVLQGMVRHTEVISEAEIVYDNAFDHMVRGGFGFWRIVAKYLNDDSFDQELYLERVRNPFSIHMDPFASDPLKSDAEYGFVYVTLSRDKYKRDYPDSQLAGIEDWEKLGDAPPGWITKDGIRVAEYFHVEFEEHELTLMSDGSTVLDGEVLPQSEAVPVQKRQVWKRRVVWTKINAVEKLDETDWPGRFIPIIPVEGIDVMVDGKRYLAGMVRTAKDPQRMYNYWASSMTEAIALAPKAPWIAAEGAISGYETMYEQSNRRNIGVLPYKQVDVGGKPCPPPTRNNVEPPVQAMVLAMRQADADLKAATGVYDPALGENPKDQSGKALSLLQKQSQLGNINWTDNLSRSIRYSTLQLIDLYPHYYDAPRIQRIINPDGSVDHVGVYNSTKQQDGAQDPRQVLEQQGIKKVFDIGKGQYDVVVSVGPSYQSKRQEAVASQLALVGAFPQLMGAAGDIIVGNMDWPQAKEISDRLKKLLPPPLQEQPDGEPTVEALQAQLAQVTQQHQLLTQALQQANQIIETKQVEGKTQIERATIDQITKIVVAKINASKDADTADADRELQMLGMAHDAAHDVALQKDQQAHEADQAQTQIAASQQAAAQQQQSDAQQGAQNVQ